MAAEEASKKEGRKEKVNPSIDPFSDDRRNRKWDSDRQASERSRAQEKGRDGKWRRRELRKGRTKVTEEKGRSTERGYSAAGWGDFATRW